VPYILGTVLFTAVAANRQAAVGQICRGSRAIIALLFPIAILLMLLGQRFLPFVYGSAYAPAGLLFVILVPGMIALAVHIVVDSFFAGQGFPTISIVSAGGALLAKVALNFVTIRRFGLIAAPIVTSVVYSLLLLVKLIAFTRQTGQKWSAILVPTWSDVRANAGTAASWLGSRMGRRSTRLSGNGSAREPSPGSSTGIE